MKKATCLLLSLLIFATPILAQNPCEDETYLELKKKKLDDLSDWPAPQKLYQVLS